MKFLEVKIPETIYSISPRKLNKILWKSFFWNKENDSVQSLTKKTTQFVWKNYFIVYARAKPRSEPAVVVYLNCLIFLSLPILLICWFFEYMLRFYVHFLQISLLGLQEVATFDFSSCFWLVPFHEGSKMISKTSRRYCKFFAVV